MELALSDFGRGAGGWVSADTYPRTVGDVNGDGRADIVGFGEAGTFVALGQADGSFANPRLAIAEFGRGAGSWVSEDTYPRAVGDVNGDGRADIVGFGEAGTYVALGQADGSFTNSTLAIAEYGRGAGGWASAETYPREVGDVNGDGRADIVGFGEAGTYVALGQADGSFANPGLTIAEFGRGAGGWVSADTYPRAVGDVNGDGRADIVGFGEAGTYVALGQVDGSFANPRLTIAEFGRGAGGWVSAETYPRAVGDVNGDGRADIVGFGEAGTYVALGQADGSFANARLAIAEFGRGAGGWVSQDTYPREVGDVNGDGRADIVGFGEAGTYVALGPLGEPARNAPVVLSQIAEGQGGGFAIVGGGGAKPAGDVNGDGLGDLLVTGSADGATYVVFGKSDATPIVVADIAAGGRGGFRVSGSGGAYAVPDLNGDGRAEILTNGGPDGPVLVFGKADATAVDLPAVAAGEGGFAILNGAGRPSLAATGVLPDVTGDGRPELLFASPGGADWTPAVYYTPENSASPPEGQAYVAFGVSEGPIRLDDVAGGEGGMLLVAGRGFSSFNTNPITLAPVADMNGDGRADLLVQANNSEGGGFHAYTVVYASPEPSRVELDGAGAGEGGFLVAQAFYGPHSTPRAVGALHDPDTGQPGGIKITDGPPWGMPGPATGFTVTVGGDLPASGGPRSAEWRGAFNTVPVSDLDGDGRPELLLGGHTVGDVPGVPFPIQTGRASYLVLSGDDEVVVTGFNNYPTGAVSDLNGDSRPELLLAGDGGSYVLFGQPDAGSVDLTATAAQGVGGVAIPGAGRLGAIPDLTGDGRPELLAQGSDGNAYVVFNDPLWIT